MWVAGVAKREPKHTTEQVVLNSSIRQVMQSRCFVQSLEVTGLGPSVNSARPGAGLSGLLTICYET